MYQFVHFTCAWFTLCQLYLSAGVNKVKEEDVGRSWDAELFRDIGVNASEHSVFLCVCECAGYDFKMKRWLFSQNVQEFVHIRETWPFFGWCCSSSFQELLICNNLHSHFFSLEIISLIVLYSHAKTGLSIFGWFKISNSMSNNKEGARGTLKPYRQFQQNTWRVRQCCFLLSLY